MNSSDIQGLIDIHFNEIVNIRRHIHQHPELSFEEEETGKFISQQLNSIGIPHSTGWAGYGVVGIIEGQKGSGKTIALRADFDALPIQEINDVPYKSVYPGKMHACGHDVHTASLLGAAHALWNTRKHWSGCVKLIFQPGEERMPGGASIMIKEGVLNNPTPKGIFGQHVHPPLEVGKIGLRSGMYMASADELYVTVTGRGGHAALPQDCIDPIVITAQIINTLQTVVSRYSDPTTPSVLTFGQINSTGGATNVIPNEVKLKGTFRTMNEEWRADAKVRMKEIAESIAKGMGGGCDFNIVDGYPFLINDADLTKKVKDRAIDYLGAENVIDLPIRMTAEDFSYFSQKMPACFYRLGTGNKEKGITSPVHTNTFDIDEEALRTGAGLMAWLAVEELNE